MHILSTFQKKISKSVAILRFLRDIFPKHILKTLYLTLTYPYFNYCNLIWGTGSVIARSVGDWGGEGEYDQLGSYFVIFDQLTSCCVLHSWSK